MRRKNYKLLNGTAIMAAILCSVQIVWLVMQSWFISGLGGVDGEINWDNEVLPFQLTVFTCRLLFCIAYNIAIIIFLIKTMKALKNGIIFPRSNISLLYFTAICYFIGTLSRDNFDNILLTQTPRATFFAIDSSTILITLLLVVFALLYKIAADISEENNLTI